MRDYGKVYSTFWSSATTGELSDDGKLLALYLMTCSHNTIAGVFRLPDGYVAEDLRWPLERVAQGFTELFDKGFANRCETTKWVWIRKHLEWNKPENPNQRKSAAKVALSVPDTCAWKQDFMRDCAEVLAIEWPKDENPLPTVPKGSANQKQEQKQKQEQEQEQNTSGEGASAPVPDAIWDEGLAYLMSCGVKESGARSFLGKMRQTLQNDVHVSELLLKAKRQGVSDPLAWLRKASGRAAHPERAAGGVAL